METLSAFVISKPYNNQNNTYSIIPRPKTRPVSVGNVTIGGASPIVVQSMINEDTLDIDAFIDAIRRLHSINCEVVHISVPSLVHAKAVAQIKQKLKKLTKKILARD